MKVDIIRAVDYGYLTVTLKVNGKEKPFNVEVHIGGYDFITEKAGEVTKCWDLDSLFLKYRVSKWIAKKLKDCRQHVEINEIRR